MKKKKLSLREVLWHPYTSQLRPTQLTLPSLPVGVPSGICPRRIKLNLVRREVSLSEDMYNRGLMWIVYAKLFKGFRARW